MLDVHLGRIAKISVAGLILIATLALGLSTAQGAIVQPRVSLEPPDAAAFITSQRDQDAATASRVTSGLFHAELDRRGLDRAYPLDPLWSEATSKLTFTFVDALADRNGFTSALYTARPKDADYPVTLWRLDLDPQGKVIWGDFLWLFGDANVRTISSTGASPKLTYSLAFAPREAGSPRPCLVFGIVSGKGDGYLALGLNCWGSGANIAPPSPVAYATVDGSGAIHPGYWSFGDTTPTSNGKSPRVFDFAVLSQQDASTLRTYEASLSAQSVIGSGLSGG